MIKKFTKCLAFSLFISQISTMQAFSAPVSQQQEYEHTHIKHVLNTHPDRNDHDSVGVLMYRVLDNRVYVLLGRDNTLLKDLSRAGKYCTLGGFAKKEFTYAENMRIEVQEESLGLIKPSTDYIVEKSAFLMKKSDAKKRGDFRRVMYALIPAGENFYIPASSLNELRQKQSASLPAAEAKKDYFLWLDLEELIDGVNKRSMIISAHDIEGQSHKVKLAKFFIDDFIKHPDLKLTINKLKTPSFQ
ncbi:MAG: hypothetical protein K0Q51_1321 [Rickettsiaceae bacterium]|jgi:hypothetical protein|nr:hypothetical protein [Rickettsiaceae bacterium]